MCMLCLYLVELLSVIKRSNLDYGDSSSTKHKRIEWTLNETPVIFLKQRYLFGGAFSSRLTRPNQFEIL